MFISLIISHRRKGNSELLGKLALKEASKLGTNGELVYLKDYVIKECNGCMRCVFKNEKCAIQDDTYKLLDKLATADCLFITAPTYLLSIPGTLKLLMDKYLIIPQYYKKIYGRPAMSIGTSGLADWNHFQLPMMNLFLLGMGFRVVDSFMARAAGPGEALLNDEYLSRIKNGVKNMLSYESKPFESQTSKHCPVCFSTIFEREGNKKYICPVCRVEGIEKEGTDELYFSKETLNNHRWTPPNVEDHFENWIKKTEGRFFSMLRNIQAKKNELDLNH